MEDRKKIIKTFKKSIFLYLYMTKTRSLICLLTGHVDHGKSQIVETITKNKIIEKEAGKITQKISTINVPFSRIKEICGSLIQKSKLQLPGFLLIDSPGHSSFTSLRKRGGNIADIAILVIDVNEGFKPQTEEALKILKHYKTPFIIALNKIDLIRGWRSNNLSLLQNINSQSDETKLILEQKLYEIVGKLHEFGFESERFDRVQDYSKQIAMVPISAKKSEGISELLLVLIGLAQKYLEKNLEVETSSQGKAVILEVNEKKGVGTLLNCILYAGSIKTNDTIAIGSLTQSITSKVKILYEDNKQVKKSEAASNISLCSLGAKNALAGMPLMVANKDLNQIKKEVQSQIDEVLIETDKEGIILKADSIGSLEALIQLLREKQIPIKRATIGEVSKKDIVDAKANKNELDKVILGFNIKKIKSDVEIISSEIIYKILDDYQSWREKKQKELEEKSLEKITKPFKLKILPNCIFRQSNPAVVGVEVLAGTVKTNTPIIKDDGTKLTEVKAIQSEGKNINEAEKGKQVAISIPGVIAFKQINENDVIISDINEIDFKKLKDMKKLLNHDEIELLKEIAEIKRKDKKLWGI